LSRGSIVEGQTPRDNTDSNIYPKEVVQFHLLFRLIANQSRILLMPNPTVAFVGLGYIGLPTAVVMANSGVNVIGVDVNAANVERINRAEVTIVEPGLEEELKLAIESGNFRATTMQGQDDESIIAVPTNLTEYYDVDKIFI